MDYDRPYIAKHTLIWAMHGRACVIFHDFSLEMTIIIKYTGTYILSVMDNFNFYLRLDSPILLSVFVTHRSKPVKTFQVQVRKIAVGKTELINLLKSVLARKLQQVV